MSVGWSWCETRRVERKVCVSESWIELLLAFSNAFLATSPLAYLEGPLTRTALSRASSAISWNLGNCFKGSQPGPVKGNVVNTS